MKNETPKTQREKRKEEVDKLVELLRGSFGDLIFRPIRGFWNKHFAIRPHLIKTDLPKSSWYDTDHRMLYGMMKMLVDYVEEEKCFEVIEWNNDERHKEVARKIKKIYNWWKYKYPERQRNIKAYLHGWSARCEYLQKKRGVGTEPMDFLTFLNTKNNYPEDRAERLLSDKLHQEEAYLYAEEQQMLKLLVEIRSYLWT